METKSYDELVQLKQDNKITWLDFINMSNNTEEFNKWCDEHGQKPTEDNAEFFIDMRNEMEDNAEL